MDSFGPRSSSRPSRWIIKNLTRQSGYERSLLTWSGTKRLMYMLSELTRDQIHRGVVVWPFTVRLTRQGLADKIGTSTRLLPAVLTSLRKGAWFPLAKLLLLKEQLQRLDDAMKHEEKPTFRLTSAWHSAWTRYSSRLTPCLNLERPTYPSQSQTCFCRINVRSTNERVHGHHHF